MLHVCFLAEKKAAVCSAAIHFSEEKINSKPIHSQETQYKIKTLYSDICKNCGPKEMDGKIQELKKLIQNIIF